VPIIAEKTIFHFSKGDYTVPDRVRFYPYKVTYVDLQDYMAAPNGQQLPVFTDIVRAKNADDAKNSLRSSLSRTVAFMSSGRYPERLGTSVRGVQLVVLNKRQLNALEREVHGGSAKLPHAINPKAFVASKPNSTLHTRPTPSMRSVPPVGAPRTITKSTPLQLSDNPIDIGGFTVGFKKPGETPVPSPTFTPPSPNPFDLANTTLSTAMVTGDSPIPAPSGQWDFTIKAGQSPIALPSGFQQTVDAYEPPKTMAAAAGADVSGAGSSVSGAGSFAAPQATETNTGMEYVKAVTVTLPPSAGASPCSPCSYAESKPSPFPLWKTIFYVGIIGLMVAGVFMLICRH
jgi:hypothetical protein